MELDSETISISSQDGELMNITKKSAELSKLISDALKDFPEMSSLPLPDIDTPTCKLIIQYLLHFNGVTPPDVAKPLRSANMRDNCDEWSADYVDQLSLDELEQVTLASSYMEIPSLVNLCIAKLVSLFRDKTDEDLMAQFRIKVKFDEQSEVQIREENPWLEEL